MDGLRRDSARNRARIIEAARGLIAEGSSLGYNAVARSAEVGVGTVYRHFANVEELEETLVQERFDELGSVLSDADPAHLDDVLTAHVTLLAEDALFEKVTARAEPALERTADTRAALTSELAELMERARELGGLRGDVDAAAVLLIACGIAHTLRIAGVSVASPQGQTLLRVMLDGLHPTARQ
ncbi:MAG: regulatory protein TetR [Glaciihabitans sp.]|nr:regulatory protein TetR [Glaciihabitans sp.]